MNFLSFKHKLLLIVILSSPCGLSGFSPRIEVIQVEIFRFGVSNSEILLLNIYLLIWVELDFGVFQSIKIRHLDTTDRSICEWGPYPNDGWSNSRIGTALVGPQPERGVSIRNQQLRTKKKRKKKNLPNQISSIVFRVAALHKPSMDGKRF